ncbi:hypothetical protein CTA2_797 [Colletotrichum tanaceti]|uniref:Uncharacterized protein n=1 Tax=Colletotrichum tanaceti TaxID=1306861 RepID=A0A4U6XJX5_9PEZI|nr:hypothetical protein CTA2_797 [Colletotrichum tanaceti]TKW56064.1 hypothetical protein CTA1_10899 [Colletotrichum tanaceti]
MEMESFRQLSDECIEEGCTSVALNSKYCLSHVKTRRRENGHDQFGRFNAAGASSRSRSESRSSRPVVEQDSPQQVGRTRTEEQSRGGQSRQWRRSSRGESNPVPSTHSQATVRKSNLPPDLVGKISLTARKSTHSPGSSKKRTEMASTSLHTNSASTYTGGSGSPTTLQRTAAGTFPLFKMFFNTSHTSSPNDTKPYFRSHSTHEMPMDSGAVAQRHQTRSAHSGLRSEITSLNTNPVTQPSQASLPSTETRVDDNGMSVAGNTSGHCITGGRKTESVTESSISGPTSSGKRSFDSMPYVRTSRLPPSMQLKSAPSALRSALTSKRKRNSGRPESTSPSTSPDETDGDEAQVPPRVHKRNAAQRHTLRWKGTNGFLTGAALNPIPLGSSEVENEEDDRASDGKPWQTIPSHGQGQNAAFSAERQHLGNEDRPLITGRVDQQRTETNRLRRRLNCEERRVQLCATFDSAKFDAMVYGQADAASPPEGVVVPTAPINGSTKTPSLGKNPEQLYMKFDPRIHWPHNRSNEWYKLKMEEIRARGGRKANFGKAAQRMRQQRLEAERRAEEETWAIEQGASVSINKQPQPWSHHRHMDFGDVSQQELPAYVRKNPEWMHATAWMRENREQNLRRNTEAAALRAAGLPWEHLFPQSGR